MILDQSRSLIMKIFEKIVKNLVNGKPDPLQFAYQAGRGVEDAKLLIVNNLCKHLEKPQVLQNQTMRMFSVILFLGVITISWI